MNLLRINFESNEWNQLTRGDAITLSLSFIYFTITYLRKRRNEKQMKIQIKWSVGLYLDKGNSIELTSVANNILCAMKRSANKANIATRNKSNKWNWSSGRPVPMLSEYLINRASSVCPSKCYSSQAFVRCALEFIGPSSIESMPRKTYVYISLYLRESESKNKILKSKLNRSQPKVKRMHF